ncbi:ATP-dependent helicase [Lampropedia aestuarii]|uniref:DNA 3'-5' helicase n=1 Tax=Lampropedia aestuarii TaxID=2562762 RepID=A0A4S5BFC9_9BURK|nr:ATP-dependent helicase [Lampropedia aestuarii]THJ31024.1 ATP-dependent helicase [Lampropedia aestuarii]
MRKKRNAWDECSCIFTQKLHSNLFLIAFKMNHQTTLTIALNSYQKAIVQTSHSFTEVLAGPGSGKTSTLLQRVLHLVQKAEVPCSPDQILVLSFSNSAVNNVKVKLAMRQECQSERERNVDLRKVRVKTIHSLSLHLGGQKNKSEFLGEKARRQLVQSALEQVYEAANKLPKARRTLRQAFLKGVRSNNEGLLQLLQCIDLMAVSGGKAKETIANFGFRHLERRAATVEAVARAYGEEKRKRKKWDHSDLIVQALDAMRAGKGDLKNIRHVLVDEYQDCSPLQTRLLVEVGERVGSLMVFGDPNQAIYSFGGGRYSALTQWMKGVETLSLPKSYRLNHPHVDFLNAFVEGGSIEALSQDAPDQQALTRVIADSAYRAYNSVGGKVQRLLDAGCLPQDICIMAREKAVLAPFESALLMRAIQTQRLGLERDLSDIEAVAQLMAVAEKYSDKEVFESKIRGVCATRLKRPFLDGDIQEITKRLRSGFRSTSCEGRFIGCWKAYCWLIRRGQGGEAVTHIRHELARWEVVARQCENAAELLKKVRAADARQGVITSTIHRAKGGEWRHVIVVGMTEGVLPSWRATTDTLLAEERRLFYVAASRAIETTAFVCHPHTYPSSHGAVREVRACVEQSSFLKPKKLHSKMRRVALRASS